jgi:hypothetical protein
LSMDVRMGLKLFVQMSQKTWNSAVDVCGL